jgi:hypothetical protein
MAILVASGQPISPPFDPGAAGLVVSPLPRDPKSPLPAFTLRHVYSVGLQGTCGCEFRRAEEARPRRALVWLLEWALRSAPEVELFAFNDGGEDWFSVQPWRRDWATAAELLSWRDFEPPELLVIQRDA